MSEPTRFPGSAGAPSRATPAGYPGATGFPGASASAAPTGVPGASTGATGHPGATSIPPGMPPAAASLPPRAALGPKYALEEGKHVRRLRIGEWEVRSTKRPILNGKEIDA